MAAVEQRSNVKFCILLKKTPKETLQMLREAYGEGAMKKTHVYKWISGINDDLPMDVLQFKTILEKAGR